MNFLNKLAAVGLAVLLASPALAETQTISQAGKKFSERKITVKVGDTVTFLNDDETTHNVHSATDGHVFDLGAQAPGESLSHTFDTVGDVKVRCAIHPKMKVTVQVVE